MFARPLRGLLIVAPLFAQVPVIDRPFTAGAPMAVTVERPGGFSADSFRIGASGETWMIDSVRLWAVPAEGAACPKELGDQIGKITLLGALDNPPVPGQPVCDCHALVAIATASIAPGGSRSSNPSAAITFDKGIWRIDFRDVRWSVPGDTDVLFLLRALSRREDACPAAAAWKLAAGPAPDGYRLHLLDKAGVPEGLAEAEVAPRRIAIQVWAHRTNP